MKQAKSCLKDDESIFLGKKSKGAELTRLIYEVVYCGIKGEIKKDALLTTLAELTVSLI